MERLEVNDGDRVTLALATSERGDGTLGRHGRLLTAGRPGPMLVARQGSRASIRIEGDHGGAVRWHGLEATRPHVSSEAAAAAPQHVELRFPDPGVFLYHAGFGRDGPASTEPHGVVLVTPQRAGYWSTVDRQRVLLFAGRIPSVNGLERPTLAARTHRVQRLYLINAAPRVLSLRLPGTAMKLVGADRGRVEREAFVDSVVLAPFERAVVEILFRHPGRFTLEHRRPGSSLALCSFLVCPGAEGEVDDAAAFDTLGDAPEFLNLRRVLPSLLAREPDFVVPVGAAPPTALPLEGRPGGEGWKVRLAHHGSGGRGHRLVHAQAGRFLVLARDGLPSAILAWKDTLLLRAGEVLDALLVPFGTGRTALHLLDADGLERYGAVPIGDEADPEPAAGRGGGA